MEKKSTAELYQYFLECTSVGTDSRSISPGAMFFALKGPNFNANTLAAKAIDAGAKYAVVDEVEFANNDNILLVENGLTALQDLARHHRRQWSIPVVGLTGSNGKTTSKELIYSVLSQKYKTYATKGNLNNHIGVPLTILNCPASAEMAIIEMGANHQKEIALLSSICQPTHGLITNIGKAHLEGFGGLAGVRKGKGELYDFLAETGGTVFVNATNDTLVEMASERTFKEKIIYQTADSFLTVQLISDSPQIQYADSEGNTIVSHLPGNYNFENIVNALAIGKYFSVSEKDANHGIAQYNPDNNRSQWITKGTNRILMDAYNANPSSMAAAISTFAQLDGENKIVILGDMFELGDDGPQEHEAIGKLLKNYKISYILLTGPLMQHALLHLPKAYYFPEKHGLHLWLTDHKLQDYQILIKGSRGMGLETCLNVIN